MKSTGRTCSPRVTIVASPRIPPRDALQKMSALRVLRALDFGAMMTAALSPSSAETNVRPSPLYLGLAGPPSTPPLTAFCGDRSAKLVDPAKGAWNGWSPASTNSRFQSSPTRLALSIDQVRGLKLKWAFGFEGDVTAFAQPTVIDGQGVRRKRWRRHVIHACVPKQVVCSGPSRLTGRFAHRSWRPGQERRTPCCSARSGRAGSILSRQKLASCSEEKKQVSTTRALDGRARYLQRQRLRAGRVLGRDAIALIQATAAARSAAAWSRSASAMASSSGKPTLFPSRNKPAQPVAALRSSDLPEPACGPRRRSTPNAA